MSSSCARPGRRRAGRRRVTTSGARRRFAPSRGRPFSAANDALLRDFAFRAIKAQPLGYLHSVLSGLAQSVLWPRRPYPNAETVYFYYFHLEPQVIPADRSWVPGGTPYSDAVQYGHATPSRVVEPFAYPDRLVSAVVLHLRAAVRADPAHRARRRRADQAPPGRTPSGLVAAAPAACCRGSPRSCCSCSRSRSPTSTTVPAPRRCRSPAWPRAWRSPPPAVYGFGLDESTASRHRPSASRCQIVAYLVLSSRPDGIRTTTTPSA